MFLVFSSNLHYLGDTIWDDINFVDEEFIVSWLFQSDTISERVCSFVHCRKSIFGFCIWQGNVSEEIISPKIDCSSIVGDNLASAIDGRDSESEGGIYFCFFWNGHSEIGDLIRRLFRDCAHETVCRIECKSFCYVETALYLVGINFIFSCFFDENIFECRGSVVSRFELIAIIGNG